MKKSLLFLFSFCILTNAFAQKIEFRVALNSGLSSYTGNDATDYSPFNITPTGQMSNVQNPYGTLKVLCFGVAASVQYVTNKNFILGANVGFDQLRSKVLVEHKQSFECAAAHGYEFLSAQFINVNPFLGYRMSANCITFDLKAGVDLGYFLNSNETTYLLDSNNSETVYSKSELNEKPLTIDVRPRIDFAVNYKKIGAFVSYAKGVSNYKHIKGYSEVEQTNANIFRFGISYQIN